MDPDAMGPDRELVRLNHLGAQEAHIRVVGIRVDKATRQATLRWYRLPRGLSVRLVELRGIEPLTPRLPASCSPS